MLPPGSTLFVNFPEESKQRVLHPARVLRHNSEGLVVRCDEPGLPLVPDRAVRLYFESKLKFAQQAGRVEAVFGEGEMPARSPADTAAYAEHAGANAAVSLGAVFIVRTLGEPVSAEGRECYRVSTLTAGIGADLGNEPNAVLADVSVTGFSIISNRQHASGSVLPIILHHEGQRYAGNAAIQSVNTLDDGRFRYGFLCADEKSHHTALKQGLQQISVAVQRQQLKRMAGVAA